MNTRHATTFLLGATLATTLVSGCGDAKRRPASAPVATTPTAAPAPVKRTEEKPAPASPAPSSPASGATASVSSETAVATPAPAPVEGEATLTLDDIVNAEVTFEDLTPEVPREEEPEGKPSLSSAVFSLASGKGLSLDVVFEKPTLWKERPTGRATNARWVLEDPHTGLVLAEGKFELPILCDCPEGKDHVEGDVRIPHATTFTLDLPRHRDGETLKVYDEAGKEIDAWSLDLPR